MKKANAFKNIVSEEKGNDVKISHENYDIVNIHYHKSGRDFSDNSDYINFIKRIERSIRSSKEYRSYIAYLKTQVKLNYCALHHEITGDMVKLEMHHGPIFTLFDCVEINMIDCFRSNKEVTSAIIANNVLHDHHDNIITVVMLCKNDHMAVHPRNKDIRPLFIPIDVCWGDSIGYLERYENALQHKHLVKINNYRKRYEQESQVKGTHFIEEICKFKVFQ